MKVLILAGGAGTRISEETSIKPKPMIEIGGKPIIWHIMKIYSHYGYNDFVICLGYKGYVIKEYFTNYYSHNSDIDIDLRDNSLSFKNSKAEPWKISLIDTGHNSMTGGRILRAKQYLNEKPFLLTYGDGVGNINIKDLVKFHNSHGKYLTVTSVQPKGRFGALDINDDFVVKSCIEKPRGDGNWINGGFFVCEPMIFDYLEDDTTIWEQAPMEKLARDREMVAYKHQGYWQPMDTLRDKIDLEKLYKSNSAPWKTW